MSRSLVFVGVVCAALSCARGPRTSDQTGHLEPGRLPDSFYAGGADCGSAPHIRVHAYNPDFFILRNLVPAGRDGNGRPIFKADRTKVTIQDVIAAEGPRLPDVVHSQRHFNTGMVVVVEHGKTPGKELLERTEAGAVDGIGFPSAVVEAGDGVV